MIKENTTWYDSQYTFEDLCKLEVGDKLWESCQYGNLYIEVAEGPTVNVEDDYVGFTATILRSEGSTRNGELVTYGSRKSYEHYGPKLYNEPVYMRGMTEDMEMLYFKSE